MSDAPVAERVEVRQRQPDTVRVGRPDVRSATTRTSVVDADQRYVLRRQLCDERIIAVDADEYGCVEAMLGARVSCLQQKWVVA
jgi:hypothetical protein